MNRVVVAASSRHIAYVLLAEDSTLLDKGYCSARATLTREFAAGLAQSIDGALLMLLGPLSASELARLLYQHGQAPTPTGEVLVAPQELPRLPVVVVQTVTKEIFGGAGAPHGTRYRATAGAILQSRQIHAIRKERLSMQLNALEQEHQENRAYVSAHALDITQHDPEDNPADATL